MIAIFDLGRTHKKFLLFDEDYSVVEETTTTVPDVKDEDGDTCEDLQTISLWMKEQVHCALENRNYDLKAINFSAHGASFVHLNKEGKLITPLYDYMKPLPHTFTEEFYRLFGGKEMFSVATSSPVLNMLNSGIQLFWLKNNHPDLFEKIAVSLHLPQYGNYIFSHKQHADITSIGCHTGLWDFENKKYHPWLKQEGVEHLLPLPESADTFDRVHFGDKTISVGIGMHDSSAALLPFVKTAEEPFVLLSSGTWNVALNPFFDDELNEDKYRKDCLYYLLDRNRKVAASRLFLGNEYDYQVKKLEAYFHKQAGYGQQVIPDIKLIELALDKQEDKGTFYPQTMQGTGPFPKLTGSAPDLSLYASFEEAFFQLMLDLTYLQKVSIELLCGQTRQLYISGGFLKNSTFMEFLQGFLPDWQIFKAENKRASPLGAAIAMHNVWNEKLLSESLSPVIPFKKQLDIELDGYQIPKLLIQNS